jgi:hypothetical protein
VDAGEWLVESRAQMDRGEAEWLERLAAFDRDQMWALDGQLSCAGWLVWRTRMARSTAFEKLKVAHELGRRPIVADAFRAGALSYSQVRIIMRMNRPDPGVDQALVDLATSGQASIHELEQVVRSYQLYADQERPPTDDDAHRQRDVRILRGDDGTGQVIVTLTELELEEFAATYQAFIDLQYRPQPVDESAAADSEEAGAAAEAPLEEASRRTKLADAFMDLTRTALAHADGGRAAGDDRYLLHLVNQAERPDTTYLDGRPLDPRDAAMIDCDKSTVVHTTSPAGEPLYLGRKTRDWNTAQRRAIAVRDGGRCRFVGCTNRFYDIHHLQEWEQGGPTDIDNGCSQCPRHHRMLHHGYEVQGNPNGALDFYRPDGTYIGSTTPAGARQLTGV